MSHQGPPSSLRSVVRLAIALLQTGTPYREVAQRVAASFSSVVRWEPAYRRGQANGLHARPISGRPCRLSAGQQEHLKMVLLGGAGAAGYPLSCGREVGAAFWIRLRICSVHSGPDEL